MSANARNHCDAHARTRGYRSRQPMSHAASGLRSARAAGSGVTLVDYNYEALGPERFQKLAQALLVAEYPDTQCLPVRQSDGGRDAFGPDPESPHAGFVVYQVKFSETPQHKSARDTITAVIASDKDHIVNLRERGATRYHIITNVHGTGHPDRGSVDRAHAALSELLSIPHMIWWRDDLDRRLDNQQAIKWSYPDILRATDILPLLLKTQNDEDALQASTRTLKGYIATQYSDDRELKFKQVELSNALTDLFIDLPVRKKPSRTDRDRAHQPRIGYHGDVQMHLDVDSHSPDDAQTPLAATFWLQMALPSRVSSSRVSRYVLEGAPGQGKSTVTQFLCQVNRLRFLDKPKELERLDQTHSTGPVRIPFRLDLRDYALWLSGRHPFETSGARVAPSGNHTSLESFIAMQVSSFSGTSDITADECIQLLQRTHSVVVLDGFDEVADISIRTTLVQEICRAADRFDARGLSVLFIITSRPAAFASSPGFPEDDWIHLELIDLQPSIISMYGDKWTEAQRLNERERHMVSTTLHAKLEQPHIRDLARNPMQLSILLHLIHVQGPALPEKRTTLYEEYMKLFLNREAEKSNIVRDQRDLILSIHGVLAWFLHTRAEKGGAGSLTKGELQRLVYRYLESKEHDRRLVDPLLTGAVERVGALVSRVVGTFEFEVQPLREYFAARHLYTTAPYSPPGNPVKGTLPDRFCAIARSPYWTNVARFFCGFYDVGQLGTLVDGLIHLDEDGGYQFINQPRLLSIMLLSDHVFAQSPKIMKRLVANVTREPAFQRLFAWQHSMGVPEMALPETAGRVALFSSCVDKLQKELDPEHASNLRRTIRQNADPRTLLELWSKRRREGLMRCHPLEEASDFGILKKISSAEIVTLTENINDRLQWLTVTDKYDAMAQEPLYGFACKEFFDGALAFYRAPASNRKMMSLELLSVLLNVHGLTELFSETSRERANVRGSVAQAVGLENSDYFRNAVHSIGESNDEVASLGRFVLDHMRIPVTDCVSDRRWWSTLVDAGLKVSKGGFLFQCIAAISTVIGRSEETAAWSDEGFAATGGLVDRLSFARSMSGNSEWWLDRLKQTSREKLVVCIAVLVAWGKPDLIGGLVGDVEDRVAQMTADEWRRLVFVVRCIRRADSRGQDRRLESKCGLDVSMLSPRLSLAVVERVIDRDLRRKLSREAFRNYDDEDEVILQAAVSNEVMLAGEQSDNVDWEYLSHLSKKSRRVGLRFLFPPSGNWSVPEHIAREVLSNCDVHSTQFVAICEQSYRTIVVDRAETVSTISERDRWFRSEE